MDKTAAISALQKMTYGLYALTAAHQGTQNAMIASWVSQVSYDPFLVMVAVHPNRYTHALITRSGCFALHVLAREQKGWIRRLKDPDPESKFLNIPWEKGVTGCPILQQCIAYLECRVVETLNPGNHTLFMGEVAHAVRLSTDEFPLSTLDYEGTYTGKQ